MIRKTWRDARTVQRHLSPRRVVPTLIRDIRSGRLRVGEVLSTTVQVALDLGGPRRPRASDPAGERVTDLRDRPDRS